MEPYHRRLARRLVLKAAAREWLTHDLGLLRKPLALLAYLAGAALVRTPRLSLKVLGFKILMRLHSSGWSWRVERRIAGAIHAADAREQQGQPTGLWSTYDAVIAESVRTHQSRATPTRILNARLLVVKSAEGAERGAIVIDYSYVFSLVAGLYDIEKLATRYDIVLEPSWAGVCTPDILLYTRLKRPVFVQTIEPKDREFIESLGSNLRAVPIAANWWADPRHVPPTAERDIDVAMVAAWADIKRHWRFFKALRALKQRGHRLTVALIGYPYDRSRTDIENLAAHYGVRDQVSTYERIPQSEVSAILARSKIHVLWSRRECANRALVEAMLSDTPVIVREGLTFGYRYPYINDLTGAFVPEKALPEAMLKMTVERQRYRPRDWTLANMTCQQATQILENSLRDHAERAGHPWARGLVVKTSALDSQQYWDADDQELFAADYVFIESCRRT